MAEKEEKKVLRVRVGDFSFQVALKDIDLECRVCKKAIVDPPIYCCDDDHCFCYTCYEKLFNDDSNCPVCVAMANGNGQLPWFVCTHNTIRSRKRHRFLEAVVAKFPKTQCKNPGCQTSMTATDHLAIHESSDCLYRSMVCFICAEPVQGTSGMQGHIDSAHSQAKCTYGEVVQFAVKGGPVKFSCGTNVMFLRDEGSSNDKLKELKPFTLKRALVRYDKPRRAPQFSSVATVVAWVSEDGLTGAGPFDSKYEFTVGLVGRDGTEVTVSAPCSSSDAAKGPICMTMTPAQIKDATNDAGYYRMTVKIKKDVTSKNAKEEETTRSHEECGSPEEYSGSDRDKDGDDAIGS